MATQLEDKLLAVLASSPDPQSDHQGAISVSILLVVRQWVYIVGSFCHPSSCERL